MKQFLLNFCTLLIFLSSTIVLNAQTPVRNSEGYVLIDYNGRVITKFTYDFIGEEFSNYFVAVKNGRWGYIDDIGKEVIPFEYDVTYPFNGSFALVGKSGYYYHINKLNQKLDTLNWPKSPLVYQRNLLLSNEAKNRVTYSDGTIALASQHELIFSERSGIIEWKKELDSVYLYTMPLGTHKIRIAEKYANVDSVVITHQGFLCLVRKEKGKSVISIYGDYEKLMLQIPTQETDLKKIRLVWNKYVFWPEGSAFYQETLFGQEVHYPMQYVSRIGSNVKTNYVFQLCDKYEKDKMMLLPNTEKWIQFNGNYITGSRIFDDIVTGDKTYTPVKVDRAWYLLNRHEDTLGITKFKHIHHIGMDKGRFFASTQDPSTSDEKWAFVNLKNGTITEEVFAIPLKNTHVYDLYENPEIYHWDELLNKVIKDGKEVFIDKNGNIIWTNPKETAITANDFFGTDFIFRFGNFKSIPKNQNFNKKQLSLKLEIIPNGINVILANTSNKKIIIEVQDNYFRASLEYKNRDGLWETIAFLPPSWCGNSYYPLEFPAEKMTHTKIIFPKGNSQTVLRVKILKGDGTFLVSNEVSASTNEGKLWVAKYYDGFGSETKELK